MRKSKVAGKQQAVKPQAIKPQKAASKGRSAFSMIMAALVVTGLLMGFNLFGSTEAPSHIEISPPSDIVHAAPPNLAVPTVSTLDLNAFTDINTDYLVGIVSGHKGYDPGAVCDDGLTEAQINYVVALEVVDLLSRQGVQADLLEEFDDRLAEYKADALVSIHADSCNVLGATGFKVARVTDSAIPEAEDQLVGCLNHQYGRYTGLPQHPASITDNMTNYHAFREIDRYTPGAIIEMGFLLEDRYLLEHRPKIVARGIAAGILCFLEATQ